MKSKLDKTSTPIVLTLTVEIDTKNNYEEPVRAVWSELGNEYNAYMDWSENDSVIVYFTKDTNESKTVDAYIFKPEEEKEFFNMLRGRVLHIEFELLQSAIFENVNSINCRLA